MHGKIPKFFYLDTLKAAFKMRNVIHRWTQPGGFSKTRAFFQFSKNWQGSSLSFSLSPFLPELRNCITSHCKQVMINNIAYMKIRCQRKSSGIQANLLWYRPLSSKFESYKNLQNSPNPTRNKMRPIEILQP